jgi:type II secretory pathway pseudopilin PulG
VVLVDVLVAVVMLGAALAVMLGLSARAISAQKSGENLQVAAMLLDEKLNLVLARGADNYGSRYGGLEGTCDPPYESFRYQIEITGGTGGDAFDVAVTVSWFESGRPRSERVETRIAPRLGDDPDPERRPQESTQRLGGA